jgi:uncharacterized protein YyaL (SSP411 family)
MEFIEMDEMLSKIKQMWETKNQELDHVKIKVVELRTEINVLKQKLVHSENDKVELQRKWDKMNSFFTDQKQSGFK